MQAQARARMPSATSPKCGPSGCKTLASPCRPANLEAAAGASCQLAPLQHCRQHSSVAAPSYCGKTAARSCEQRSYITCCKLVVALLYATRAPAPLVHCVAATPPPRSCVDCIAATPPPRPSTKQPCGSAYCSRRSRACASRGASASGRAPRHRPYDQPRPPPARKPRRTVEAPLHQNWNAYKQQEAE